MISVVVPVYKTEDYLSTCVQSILKQTYTDLEVILIDDGSPDNCGKICDFWAEKDTRVRVIHQVNKGGAAARNKALDICKGEYIIFVDSDDYVAPCFCECLLKNFNEEIDIVECGYIKTEADGAVFDINAKDDNVNIYSTIEAMGEYLSGHVFQQIIWNKMYRKSVIGDIRFVEGKQIDDEFWTYRIIGNARKLVQVEQKLYAYRQQVDSVMHSISIDKRIQAFEAIVLQHEYICHNFPALEGQSLHRLWFAGMYYKQLILRTCSKEKINCAEIINQALSKYPVKDFSERKKSHIVWLWLAKLNFNFTCRLRNILKIGM